jgi:hypothetical protein
MSTEKPKREPAQSCLQISRNLSNAMMNFVFVFVFFWYKLKNQLQERNQHTTISGEPM